MSIEEKIWIVAITQTPHIIPIDQIGGRRSLVVACWASDHWVASSNPLGGKFRH